MRLLLSTFLVLTTLSFTACSSYNTPAEVSDVFLTSLANGDQKKARKYATLNTI